MAALTRKVYLALGLAVVSGACLLEGSLWAGLGGTIGLVKDTLLKPGTALLVLFILALGALLSTVQKVDGLSSLTRRLERSGYLSSARSVRLVTWSIGIGFFLESNMTILVNGAFGRPLFDKWKISREKLAYLIDSTSGPICLLIPFNAWGAYVISLLDGVGEEQPVWLFLNAVIYNAYAFLAVGLAFVVAYFDFNLGPMKRAEERTSEGEVLSPGAELMADESLFTPAEKRPDGSLGQLLVHMIKSGARGVRGMVPLATVILLALTLALVTERLGTGAFVARVISDHLSVGAFLPLTFLLGAAVSFATGTSWGTFAILIPVILPASHAFGAPTAPFLGAILSGGLFGDHASPISNTTIIASMAALTDHMDHVKTQLPYALLAATGALAFFVALGFMMPR